jgi:hypothetical protein
VAKLRVFISWSGERSKALALGLRDWLPLVLHYVEPWLSEADIEAGERWAQSVAKELAASNFGVICVTPENMGSPWLLFEAGALTKSLEASKVVPLLLGLEFSDISGPLAQFQAKKLTREGAYEVVRSLQGSADEPIPEDRAARLFDLAWADFETKLGDIVKEAPSERHPRSTHEVLEELVAGVRALDARAREQQEVAPDSWRARRGLPAALRMDPMFIVELPRMLSEDPDDPIGLLVLASVFRDDLPWLYEMAVDAYHAVVDRRPNAERLARRFARAVDMTMHMSLPLEELGADRRALSIVRHELPQLIERYTEQLGTRRAVASRQKDKSTPQGHEDEEPF